MNKTSWLTGAKTILHIVAGILIFIVVQSVCSLVFLIIPQEGIARILFTVIQVILLCSVLSIYCKKFLGITLADCGVTKPKTFFIWLICAVVLPVMVSCFFVFLVPGNFAVSNLSKGQIISQLVVAIFGTCISAGVTEELVFRGFAMKILEIRWGKKVAIIVPSVIFGLMHIGNMENPNMVDILTLVIAGTGVGIMFSLIVYQSSSIWASAIVHGIWNLVIIGGILDIGITHQGTNLFTYTLTSNSTLLTGGAFGIESSVPAIIGYFLVSVLAFIMIKKRTTNIIS